MFDEGAERGALPRGDFLGAAQERRGDFEGGFHGLETGLRASTLRGMGVWVKRSGR